MGQKDEKTRQTIDIKEGEPSFGECCDGHSTPFDADRRYIAKGRPRRIHPNRQGRIMPSFVIAEKCDGCKGGDKTACM